jgi:hypothetical protein
MSVLGLHRKQYLMGQDDIQKIAVIREKQGKSAAEVVRDAIKAYDPLQENDNQIPPDMLAFLSSEIDAAIQDTRKSNTKLESLLTSLEGQH